MNKITSNVAALIMAFGATLSFNSQTLAQSKYYYLRAKHSGQCLNVLDSGRDNGDNVVQGDECSSDNFQWATIPASSSFSSPSGPYNSGDRNNDQQEQLERRLRILQDLQKRY